MLNKETNRPVSELVTLSLFDRVSDFLAISILAFFGLSVFITVDFQFAISIVIGFVLISMALLLQPVFYNKLSPKLSKIPKAGDIIDRIYMTMATKLGSTRFLFCIIISIFSWSLEGISLWVLLQINAVSATVEIAIMIFFIATLVGTLSFLPGGIGSTEVVMTTLLTTILFVPISSAISFTLIIRFTTIWFGTTLGVIFYTLWIKNLKTQTIHDEKDTSQYLNKTLEISVILPVYSETTSISYVVSTLFDLIGEHIFEVLIIISPNSPEETFEYCRLIQSEYPNKIRISVQKENPGLGRAIRQGIILAQGTHILTIDSDGELDPRDSKKMVEKLISSQCDMVVASRWMKGGGVKGYHPVKKIFTKLFSSVFRIFFVTPIHDLSLGYKLIVNNSRFKEIQFKANKHDIATETTLKPIKNGFKACEIPTIWEKRGSGVSKNKISNNFLYIKMALNILLRPTQR